MRTGPAPSRYFNARSAWTPTSPWVGPDRQSSKVIWAKALMLPKVSARTYDLRERFTPRKRLEIESKSQMYVTGAWRQPGKSMSPVPSCIRVPGLRMLPSNNIYIALGEGEKALAAAQEAVKLGSRIGPLYANLTSAYLNVNRLDEAKAVTK